MICIACTNRAVALHHCVYQQHVRKHGGDVRAERNLVGICDTCHSRHHSRIGVLPSRLLPDRVLDFAVDLMGADATFEYMRRYYKGPDPRVDSLLPEQRRAA